MTMTTNNNIVLESYTHNQIEFLKFLQENRAALTVFDDCTVARRELVDLLSTSVYVAVPAWIATDKNRRAGRGNYMIPELNVDLSTLKINTNIRGRKPGSRNQKGVPATPAPSMDSVPIS